MTQDTTEKTLADHVAEAVRRSREEWPQSWKIHAIRHLRIATGAGLVEAKTLIERYEATGDCRTEDEVIRDRLSHAEATIERLTGPEARERLARHLYITARGRDAESRAFAASIWDASPSAELRHAWRGRADEALAVIAGKER